MFKKSEQKGFTLIEVIVAIAVVAILAGVITPSVIKHLDDSKRARAQNDCLVIGSAIGSFYKDVGRMAQHECGRRCIDYPACRPGQHSHVGGRSDAVE